MSSIRLCVTVIVPPTLAKPPPLEASPPVERTWSSVSVPKLTRLPPKPPKPSAIVRFEIVTVTAALMLKTRPGRADDEHARGAHAGAVIVTGLSTCSTPRSSPYSPAGTTILSDSPVPPAAISALPDARAARARARVVSPSWLTVNVSAAAGAA